MRKNNNANFSNHRKWVTCEGSTGNCVSKSSDIMFLVRCSSFRILQSWYIDFIFLLLNFEDVPLNTKYRKEMVLL